jgi:hypothetical protein
MAPAFAAGADSFLDWGRSVPTHALAAINPRSETGASRERPREWRSRELRGLVIGQRGWSIAPCDAVQRLSTKIW